MSIQKKNLSGALDRALAQLAPDGPIMPFRPNLAHPQVREVIEMFGLDRDSRYDRDRLLMVFMFMLFGHRLGLTGRGRPKRNRPGQLSADVDAVRNGEHRKKSDREISRILTEDSYGKFGGRYKGMGADALRHRLRELRKSLGDN